MCAPISATSAASVLLGVLFAFEASFSEQVEKPKLPIDRLARRLPDLEVTQFALTGPATKTFSFLPGAAPSQTYPGYIFVPLQFRIVNSGKADAQPFKITVKFQAGAGKVERAGFVQYFVKQDHIGGGGGIFSSGGAPPGVLLQLKKGVPVGGEVKALSAVVALRTTIQNQRVVLWVVADDANELPEANESNNESKRLSVAIH